MCIGWLATVFLWSHSSMMCFSNFLWDKREYIEFSTHTGLANQFQQSKHGLCFYLQGCATTKLHMVSFICTSSLHGNAAVDKHTFESLLENHLIFSGVFQVVLTQVKKNLDHVCLYVFQLDFTFLDSVCAHDSAGFCFKCQILQTFRASVTLENTGEL